METTKIETTKMKIRQIALSVIAIFVTVTVYSQNSGTVEGVVLDFTTAEYLPGAHVILEEKGLKTTTDDRGRFYFAEVPVGTYTLTTSYLGLKNYSAQITVNSPGERVVLEVLMESEFEELNEVVLSGNRFGQSKALNQQKEAENVKNVVSEEQIERFPDLNTAEVLQRVPGVTIQRSNGEGRLVERYQS